MKTKSQILTLAAILLLFSCSKDETKSPESYISYNDCNYSISQAILEYTGESLSPQSGSKFILTLASPKLKVDKLDNTGKGSSMFFGICSNSKESLQSGTYIFDNEGLKNPENYAPFTFRTGSFELNSDYDNPTWENGYGIKSGTIEISRENGITKINIDCISTKGKPVRAYFEGQITQRDISDFL